MMGNEIVRLILAILEIDNGKHVSVLCESDGETLCDCNWGKMQFNKTLDTVKIDFTFTKSV